MIKMFCMCQRQALGSSKYAYRTIFTSKSCKGESLETGSKINVGSEPKVNDALMRHYDDMKVLAQRPKYSEEVNHHPRIIIGKASSVNGAYRPWHGRFFKSSKYNTMKMSHLQFFVLCDEISLHSPEFVEISKLLKEDGVENAFTLWIQLFKRVAQNTKPIPNEKFVFYKTIKSPLIPSSLLDLMDTLVKVDVSFKTLDKFISIPQLCPILRELLPEYLTSLWNRGEKESSLRVLAFFYNQMHKHMDKGYSIAVRITMSHFLDQLSGISSLDGRDALILDFLKRLDSFNELDNISLKSLRAAISIDRLPQVFEIMDYKGTNFTKPRFNPFLKDVYRSNTLGKRAVHNADLKYLVDQIQEGLDPRERAVINQKVEVINKRQMEKFGITEPNGYIKTLHSRALLSKVSSSLKGEFLEIKPKYSRVFYEYLYLKNSSSRSTGPFLTYISEILTNNTNDNAEDIVLMGSLMIHRLSYSGKFYKALIVFKKLVSKNLLPEMYAVVALFKGFRLAKMEDKCYELINLWGSFGLKLSSPLCVELLRLISSLYDPVVVYEYFKALYGHRYSREIDELGFSAYFRDQQDRLFTLPHPSFMVPRDLIDDDIELSMLSLNIMYQSILHRNTLLSTTGKLYSDYRTFAKTHQSSNSNSGIVDTFVSEIAKFGTQEALDMATAVFKDSLESFVFPRGSNFFSAKLLAQMNIFPPRYAPDDSGIRRSVSNAMDLVSFQLRMRDLKPQLSLSSEALAVVVSYYIEQKDFEKAKDCIKLGIRNGMVMKGVFNKEIRKLIRQLQDTCDWAV